MRETPAPVYFQEEGSSIQVNWYLNAIATWAQIVQWSLEWINWIMRTDLRRLWVFHLVNLLWFAFAPLSDVTGSSTGMASVIPVFALRASMTHLSQLRHSDVLLLFLPWAWRGGLHRFGCAPNRHVEARCFKLVTTLETLLPSRWMQLWNLYCSTMTNFCGVKCFLRIVEAVCTFLPKVLLGNTDLKGRRKLWVQWQKLKWPFACGSRQNQQEHCSLRSTVPIAPGSD